MLRRWHLAIPALLTIAAALYVVVRSSGPQPVDVTIEPAQQREKLQSFVTASGEIVATRYADVGSSVMGTVVELAVREGDRVRAGETLARIDPVQARSDTEAAVAQIEVLESEEAAARGQVEVARAELAAAIARTDEASKERERVLMLHSAGLLSIADRDAATAAADTAAAQAAAARSALGRADQSVTTAGRRVVQARALATGARDVLGKTSITAPIDGVVSRLQVRAGEMVVIGLQNQPGTTLMTISDLSSVDAEVKVSEADVLRLAVDQPATVTLDAVSGKLFAGRVVEIGTSALPFQGAGAAAREFRVVIRLAEGIDLRPGMTCDAEILVEERRDVTVVPLQAVVLRTPTPAAPEQAGVFVVREGQVVFTPVATGIIGGLSIEVSGVAPGAVVVSGPYQTLRTLQPGDAVRTAPESTP